MLTLDLAGAGLLVEPLGVALLDDGERRVDEDLYEREAALRVQRARDGAVGAVRRDERGERDARRVREELRDLACAGAGCRRECEEHRTGVCVVSNGLPREGRGRGTGI